ncbi:LOW QUALITY PROTEIN: pirin-like protein [Haliotis rubra]|uniref:LOW QUALITY PROTEIN: pirin-like protein n=1 Tax=Haliotis rubra TaxID=36100 RepID=UPI001EE5073B|nr:LOW QUALITY PROTEIN: pirin-like protein [Haliotis rubra]
MAQRTVVKIATPKLQREGGGFLVRRVIGGVVPRCDPFLMLDHIGPTEHKPGEALGAPDHPHRGFETVTYVIDGGVKHQDSAGNKGVLKAGWVQWMTAGSGVVHSEMPTDDLLKNGGKQEGFQLWVNLPSKNKMMEPRYQEVPAETIPSVKTPDGNVIVKVIAGESLGAKSTIETLIPIMFLDIHLKAESQFSQTIPESCNGFVYVWRGAGFVGHNLLPAHMGQIGVLGETGSEVLLKAGTQDCHVLLVCGQPINEPVVQYGPFVMNTQAEIDQAIEDYRAGKLGEIPGKEDRFRQTEAAQAMQKKNSSAT